MNLPLRQFLAMSHLSKTSSPVMVSQKEVLKVKIMSRKKHMSMHELKTKKLVESMIGGSKAVQKGIEQQLQKAKIMINKSHLVIRGSFSLKIPFQLRFVCSISSSKNSKSSVEDYLMMRFLIFFLFLSLMMSLSAQSIKLSTIKFVFPLFSLEVFRVYIFSIFFFFFFFLLALLSTSSDSSDELLESSDQADTVSNI